jgi:hypothetical protein
VGREIETSGFQRVEPRLKRKGERKIKVPKRTLKIKIFQHSVRLKKGLIGCNNMKYSKKYLIC